MRIDLDFPGGMAVDATVNGFNVHTDQPAAVGGGGTGPAPFDFFLVSLATCAGLYALRFCQQRDIPTEGLAVGMDATRDPATRELSLRIGVKLPADFPEKYRDAIIRACDQCAVKKALEHPPAIETVIDE